MLNEILSLSIALHHANDGGFLGSWIGPLVIAVLIIAALAWASRSRRP